MQKVSAPAVKDTDSDFNILYSTLCHPDYSATVTAVREVEKHTDRVRQLTDAIAEMERPYIPTFLSS